MYHVTQRTFRVAAIERAVLDRCREIGNPLVSLLLAGLSSYGENYQYNVKFIHNDKNPVIWENYSHGMWSTWRKATSGWGRIVVIHWRFRTHRKKCSPPFILLDNPRTVAFMWRATALGHLGHLEVQELGTIQQHGSAPLPLQWRHNERHGISIVCSAVCSGAHQRKTSKLRLTGLCEGGPSVTGGFPSQMASNAESISVWARLHVHQMSNPWCAEFALKKHNTYMQSWSFSIRSGCRLFQPFLMRDKVSYILHSQHKSWLRMTWRFMEPVHGQQCFHPVLREYCSFRTRWVNPWSGAKYNFSVSAIPNYIRSLI